MTINSHRTSASPAPTIKAVPANGSSTPPRFLRPGVGAMLAAALAAGALALAATIPGGPSPAPERVVADERGQVRAVSIVGNVSMHALEAAVAGDQLARTGERSAVRCEPATAPGYGERAWCAVAGAIDGGAFLRYFEDGSFKWAE